MQDSTAEQTKNEQSGVLAWMARKSIAANLLMFLLIAGGFWTAAQIQKEVFPRFELDIVNVSIVYPGATPAEVEQGILQPVEEAIRGVQGIREITSTAREGSGTVEIELVSGINRMKAFQDIDQAVNRIRTFPDDIEEPEVILQIQEREVMQIGLFGEVDIWELRQLGEQLRTLLLNQEGITQVELNNVPDYVTHVEIPRDVLRKYGITLGDIAALIQRSSNDIPAGAIETETGEILLRMNERKQWADQFGAIEVLTGEAGAILQLSDIATITDGFEESGFHSQFNQQPSVEINVFRVGNQSPLKIAEIVQRTLKDFEASIPANVQTRLDNNAAEDYRQRLSILVENGLMAVVIVLVILSVFLEFRLALWVMAGMVVSFTGGILFLPMVGVSINMISMFAFLVVLGIVVDDAIVVGENIYEFRQQGNSLLNAAILGVKDIASPVIFSILTNIVAFIPLLFIPGTTGKFWWPIPVVVIVVLLISLFEALFILPAHLGHVPRRSKSKIAEKLHHFQQQFSKGFSLFVNTKYRRFLELCLRNRYVTICAAIALFIIVGGYGYSGHMGMILMPEVAADEIEAGVRLPVGTTPAQAGRVAEEVTRATQRMFDEHDLYKVAEGIKTNVRGDNFIDVEIVMRPPDQHNTTATEVIQLWRNEIGDIEGVDQITFEAESGPGGWRQDISVDLSHDDIDILAAASREFFNTMERYEATADVSDNYNKGKKQLDMKLLPEGRLLGLTADAVGRQVRDAFFGALALRQLRGTNEIEVRVKLPKSERESLHAFEDIVIFTPDSTEVPLLEVVKIEETDAFSSINRRNGRRVVTVSMDVEPKREIGRVIDSIRSEELPKLQANYPGLTYSFQGSQADMRESTRALWGGFALAMLVIYSLLAVAFGSYLQPLIVMVAIPFGVIGSVIGHMLLGFDLSLISLMGMIALSGVVVNDSLIMIDHANRRRDRESAFEAISLAGTRRFRPIILTTLTTFGGLAPLILESSQQADYLVPMAISLGFGIVFATAIILILVPSLYLAFEDVAQRLRTLAK